MVMHMLLSCCVGIPERHLNFQHTADCLVVATDCLVVAARVADGCIGMGPIGEQVYKEALMYHTTTTMSPAEVSLG